MNFTHLLKLLSYYDTQLRVITKQSEQLLL